MHTMHMISSIYLIETESTYLQGMGGQHNFWGLFISSSFGEGECSESCTTYKNYKQLCNTKKFKIVKLEAWAVGEQPLSAEEMVSRKLFMNPKPKYHSLTL